jgi:cell division protein FtsI/penicillin-binding protein 2
MSARLSNRRIRLLVAFFALVFAVALGRAAWLQAVRGPDLERLATSQQRETITLPARRGTIFDRMGVELAIGEEATTVYANPSEITRPRALAAAVSQDLGIEEREILAAIADRSKTFVYIQRKADPDKAAALAQRELRGLGFYAEEQRIYPQRRTAASLIGYAGVDNTGLAGVELEYDEALTGSDGEETIVRDPFGTALDVVESKRVEQGKDVFLTIDARLQARVEEILAETLEVWGAKAVTGVVVDTRTGGVLALAQQPGFDANNFPDVEPERVRARAVTDTYEPGSTFKVVTAAAAIDDGMVTPSSAFTLPAELEVADRTIHDAEERGTETMSVTEILSRSSNVGAVMLALNLGKQRLAWWINRFGFGQKLGLDFPGESAGIVLKPREWTGSTIGNVPIGQGIAVTPLQMVSVYAALANGGVWIRPHLAERVGDDRLPKPESRRIVDRSTARQLIDMMRDVVAGGTGTEAEVAGYTVAGKTGTAAKPDESGGYSDTQYVASFVGIVPATAPRLAILVAVDEPHGDIYGGTVAAPAFAQIAEFALRYLDVPPDEEPASAGSGG